MKCIVAHDNKFGIGKNNKLPWNIPEDLKRFRKLTEHSTMIMGSKTFFSLPINKRPLPGKYRKSIVITYEPNDSKFDEYRKTENLFVYTMDEFMTKYTSNQRDDMFVIGGSEIIKLFKPLIREIHVTRVFGDFQCDTFIRVDELTSTWEMTVHEEYKDHDYSVYKMKIT
tara:strand:+ start:2495 stop:3001 length:507 start_codon:yes stop_codon:yes gene_type:complete